MCERVCGSGHRVRASLNDLPYATTYSRAPFPFSVIIGMVFFFHPDSMKNEPACKSAIIIIEAYTNRTNDDGKCYNFNSVFMRCFCRCISQSATDCMCVCVCVCGALSLSERNKPRDSQFTLAQPLDYSIMKCHCDRVLSMCIQLQSNGSQMAIERD